MRTCSNCGRESAADFQFCPHCAAPLPSDAATREQRKVVTVLFCDVVGSTALGESVDPEALRTRLARYFERMRTIVESHGGTVEKFIGDAVMAVFGVPVAHEDDALRAVRAAADMQAALPDLGVQARIGVNTGEVVTGTEERLATGDAVNVAARLEQAADAGEVVVGPATFALVKEAIEAEALPPLVLKGKAEPVVAYRLSSVRQAPDRQLATPMVGREAELARLRAAFEQAVTASSCELVTVVGEAGVGKSRLVKELLTGLDATIAVGRCLPYGEGITYWPVVEVVKRLGVHPDEEGAEAAIQSLLGERESVVSSEEIAWGFRKVLEQCARRRPVVVVFDDIQWGEQTFLDLVEHLALLSTGASILVVCMARPELDERRAGWPVTLRLEPLAEDAVNALIPEALGESVRERIARAAGGNPLFVEQLVEVAVESDGDVTPPPTLQALLAARLDQLDDGDRRVLQCAAVEGEVFHLGAVQALADADERVTRRLAALARRGIVNPDRGQLAGEDAFRFRHLLIRDAAYEALTKTARSDLHRRLATWFEDHGSALVERDELVGYHFEQAARCMAELGTADAALDERAAAYLAAAGRRALWRVDEPAAASLLERAVDLTRPHRLDVHLELDFSRVFLMADSRRAADIANAAAERAEAEGDSAGAALARVVAIHSRLWFQPEYELDELEAHARAALPLLEEAGDNAALARVWQALATVASDRGAYAERRHAHEEVIRYRRLAGLPQSLTGLTLALLTGPTPADEALEELDAALAGRAPTPEEMLLRGVLIGMHGRFDEAWPLAIEANDRLRPMRGDLEESWLAEIAILASDYEAAERHLRRAYEWAESQGLRNILSGTAPQLARVLCTLGRPDAAAPLARLGRELAAEDDIWAQILWRQATALVEAALGEHTEAERLAREALALADRSENLSQQGDALGDLGEVLAAAGRIDDAVGALEQALGAYDRKRNVAMAAQVRARLAELQEHPLPA